MPLPFTTGTMGAVAAGVVAVAAAPPLVVATFPAAAAFALRARVAAALCPMTFCTSISRWVAGNAATSTGF